MQRLPWLSLPCTLVLALGAGACDDAAGTPDAAPGPDADQLDSGGGPVDAGGPDAAPQICIDGYLDPDFYARFDFRPFGSQVDQQHEWLAPLNARACTETHADSLSTLYTMVHTYDNSTGQRLSSVRTPETSGSVLTTAYEYDKEGNLTSTLQTTSFVGVPAVSRVSYTYDGSCNTTLKSYDFDDDGTEDHQHSYTYDAAGHLLTSVIPDGGPGQFGSTVTYTYNQLGFPLTITRLDSGGSTPVTDTVVYLPNDAVDRMDIDFNEDQVTDNTRDFVYGDGDQTPSITVTEDFGKGARQYRIYLDSQQRIVRWERGFSGGGTTDVITYSYGCFKTSG